jgi:hypothetical protein
VRGVHLRYEDPATGRAFGLRLRRLHTRRPGEADHGSAMLAEDAGAEHSSAAARGSVQKQFAAEGLSFYWQEEEGGAECAAPPGGEAAAPPGEERAVLQPTDFTVHLTSQPGGREGGGLRVHAAAVVHALPLVLCAAQAADMLRCGDELAWLGARAKYAHLRPPQATAEQQQAGRRSWGAMWRFAVNAALLDARGDKGAAAWQPARALMHTRRRYVLLYRKKLELEAQQAQHARPRQRTSSGGGGAAAAPEGGGAALSSVGAEQLRQLECALSVSDIVGCRAAARRSVQPAAGPPPPPPPPPPPGAPADGAARRKTISWGLARAAGVLGYVPRSEDAEVALPAPSDSEVQELYAAVDFHPDDELAAAGAAAGGAPAAAAAAGAGAVHLTLGCLVSSASLSLMRPGGAPLASLELQGLRFEGRHGPEGAAAEVTLAGARALEWVTHGPGVAGVLLSRAPDAHFEDEEQAALRAPLLRLQCAAGAGRGAAQGAPTLDVLLQALRIRARPACFRALGEFMPPALEGTFGGRGMAAVNALGAEARAALKARAVRRLGPCLDLVAKIVDVQVVLGGEPPPAGAAAAGGDGLAPGSSLVLSTGTVLVHSAAQPSFPTAAATHALLEALLERRRAAAGAAAAGGGPPPGADAALAAAVAGVEEHLVHQQLQFSVAGVQALAHLPPLEHDDDDDEAAPRPPPRAREAHAVLRPAKLAGSLKLCRLAEDYGVAQAQCSLQVEVVEVALTTRVLRMVRAALDAGGPPAEAAAEAAALAPAPSAAGVEVVAGTAQTASSPAAMTAGGTLLAALDVRLGSVEVSYVVEERGGKGGAEAAAHVGVGVRGGSLALQAFAAGGAAVTVRCPRTRLCGNPPCTLRRRSNSASAQNKACI